MTYKCHLPTAAVCFVDITLEFTAIIIHSLHVSSEAHRNVLFFIIVKFGCFPPLLQSSCLLRLV